MAHITEYLNRGKPAFKGVSICIDCKKVFHLDTTDKSKFDTIRCFTCFMYDDVQSLMDRDRE